MSSSRFNKDQLQAIHHLTGPAMVIAGPGSGKTTVITNRVKHLIESGTAKPSEILVITFTVAAASEMKDRYLKLCAENKPQAARNASGTSCSDLAAFKASSSGSDFIPSQPAILQPSKSLAQPSKSLTKSVNAANNNNSCYNYSAVTFGTFHSVFYHFLRSIPRYAGLRLAETTECISILKDIVHRLNPDNRYTSDYYTYILNRISYIKNTENVNRISGHSGDIDLPFKVMAAYQEELLKRGLIDFDDMLVLFNRSLSENSSFRNYMRGRFKFILIDEFQDINRVQFDAVRTLAAPLNNIFVVGDDDQSIYAFRGSDPSIMLGFKNYYPNVKFIELFTNYRSTDNIIKAASKLIAHNKDRYDKNFSGVKPLRLPVAISTFRTLTEEAQFVADDIMRLPKEIKTVGILYRTHRTGIAVKQAVARQEARQINTGEHAEAGYHDDNNNCGSGSGIGNGSGNASGSGIGNDRCILQGHKISCMTFHASKGLEFDAVYIISANEGITPSKSTGEKGISEERRLFYVAMTRAKQFLHISDTHYIYNKSQTRSRFVREALGLKVAAGAIFRNIL